VLVTRPADAARELVERLQALGADVVLVPLLDVVSCASGDELQQIATADWVVFTSANGVRFGLDAAVRAGVRHEHWAQVRLAAVGPATAEALRRQGLSPNVVGRHGGAALGRELIAMQDAAAQRFVLLRAQQATPALPRILREHGAQVIEVTVYRTQRREPTAAELARLAEVDAAIFTSPSAVDAFVALGGHRTVPASCRLVSIGRRTSAALKDAGLDVAAQTDRPGVAGLADATIAALVDAGR
jgi:uroporphyrinogen-III synthase